MGHSPDEKRDFTEDISVTGPPTSSVNIQLLVLKKYIRTIINQSSSLLT